MISFSLTYIYHYTTYLETGLLLTAYIKHGQTLGHRILPFHVKSLWRSPCGLSNPFCEKYIMFIVNPLCYQYNARHPYKRGRGKQYYGQCLVRGPSRFEPGTFRLFREGGMLSTCLHQCRQLVHQRPSMCHYVYVMMHVKDPQLSVVRVGHCVPLAGFCLSLYSLHVLNRDVNMIQTKKIYCTQLCLHYH